MHPVPSVTGFSEVLHALVDGVVTIDVHGVIVYVNVAAERVLGHQRSFLLGKTYTELRFLFPIEAGSDAKKFERDGKWFQVQISFVEPGARLVQFRDVTAQVRAETELLRSQEFLQAVLDNIEAGIAACDETGTLRFSITPTRSLPWNTRGAAWARKSGPGGTTSTRRTE